MSDRDSAEIFHEVFTMLASDPTPQHIAWAKKLWKLTGQFDFSNYQLECETALAKLQLARKRVDLEEPEEGKVWFYGPEGKDSR